jgi:hypothetical protein
MLKSIVLALAATLALSGAVPANAQVLETSVDQSMIVLVSGGCGPDAWRGPWGHCRDTPYPAERHSFAPTSNEAFETAFRHNGRGSSRT